jgi:4-amino-4-deoxy-L-arabinose transferase-like glycosyltransferase
MAGREMSGRFSPIVSAGPVPVAAGPVPGRRMLADLALLAVLGAALFLPFLGSVHLFDWDEVNFAECSREMLLTGDYLRVEINYEAFPEKPPLFIWLQALSMKTLGVGEAAARAVNAFCGIATLLVVYLVGRRLFSRRFGWLWALAFLGSLLPSVFFRSGVIDPVFNLLTFVGIAALARGALLPAASRRLFLLAGAAIGLAVLSKGPTAFLVALLCLGVYWASRRFAPVVPAARLVEFSLAVCAIAAMYYLTETLLHGPRLVTEFVRYLIRLLTTGDAGQGRPFWFHAAVLLFGCFPASAVALASVGRLDGTRTPEQADFRRWMVILFWVVLVLFSVVKTKTVLYSSLAYFPITFLAADGMDAALGAGTRVKARRLAAALGSLGAAVAGGLTLFIVLLLHKEWLTPLVRDPFALAVVSKPVAMNGWEPLIGFAYLALLAAGVALVWRPARLLAGLVVVFAATAITLEALAVVLAPRIESYTQGGPVQFYESLRGCDCYAKSLFKTYNDLFYWRKPPGMRRESYDATWLLTGAIDRPAYFVARVDQASDFVGRYDLRVLKDEYGYVYFRRDPPR